MSIRQASEGILKNHVTWKEFEKNLTKALNTTAQFGPNKSATDIGEGNGFASRCGLIDCDWKGEEAEKLPKRVVLKMGSCTALMDLDARLPEEQSVFKGASPELWKMMEKGIKDMHNTECDTYDFLELIGRGKGHAVPTRYYARSFTDEYYGATVPSTIHKQLGIAPVLVHGDMRTENVILDKDSGELRALIDWQCSHLGVGVEDLLRISFFAQTTADRRNSSEVLIEEMYASFVENLGSIPVPYTVQQLKEVYDLLFPHCALFFATGLGVHMPSAKSREGDEEEKNRKYEVVVDKARGVLEDIVTYHEKNKSSKHSVNWKYPAA